MPVVIGAVLAAGAGRRMGGPKAELRAGGVRLVDRAVGVLRAGGCARVVVVGRAGLRVQDAETIHNEDPDRGLRSSLRLAVDAAAGADALAVLLVDTPGIGAAAVSSVVAAWRPGRIAVGSYAGQRAHPTVMAPAQWYEALAVAGPDEGARRYLRSHSDLVDEIAVPGDPGDVDTPGDLRRHR